MSATRAPDTTGPEASALAVQVNTVRRRVVCEWRLERGDEVRQIELNFDEAHEGDRVEATLRRVNLSLEGEVPLRYDTDADRWLPLNEALGRTWTSTRSGSRTKQLKGLAALRKELAASHDDAAPPVRGLVDEAFDEAQVRRHLEACRSLGALDGSTARRLALWPTPEVGLLCAVSVTRQGGQLEGRLTAWDRLGAGSGPKIREPELTFTATLARGRVSRAELKLSWRTRGEEGAKQLRFRLRYSVETIPGAAQAPKPN
ncbi:MAG: hypothetical protein JKY65_34335 [Planctomycetes bacterium]|nr:hypothetical protein [Planctomycetota bacterium]